MMRICKTAVCRRSLHLSSVNALRGMTSRWCSLVLPAQKQCVLCMCFRPLAGDIMGLLAPEDIEQTAAYIPNNSTAGLLLFEHTWAIGLKEAIKNAGGVAVAGGLVAPEVLQALEADLDAAKQGARQEKAAVKAAE